MKKFQILGQKTISARWVVTSKLIDGVLKNKARPVAQEFEEGEAGLGTDSPTCMKESLRLIFPFRVSKHWNVWCIDNTII